MAKTKKEKEEKEENPMYRQICTNSKDCSCERKSTNLGDMMVTSCTQCFHIFEWEKISVNKKFEAPKSKTGKSAAETEIKKAEAVVSKESETVEKSNSETNREADELKETFAAIDSMSAELEEETVQESKPEPLEEESTEVGFDPFAEEEEAAVIKVGYFKLIDFSISNATTLRLVCITDAEKRFIVEGTTAKEKVDMIRNNPAILQNKVLKVEYSKVDAKGCPTDPEMKAIMKPEAVPQV